MSSKTREQHRQRKSQRREAREVAGRHLHRSPVGNLGQTLEALASMAGPGRFEDIRESIVPMLPRRHPVPDFGQRPVTAILAPGIPVGFAIDTPHAYGSILVDSLADWGVDAGMIAMTAISNVRRRAATRKARDVEDFAALDTQARILRPRDGLESTLILAPDLIERFFGPEPLIVAAPLREVLIAFDWGTDLGRAFEVSDALAESDPRGLAVDPMRLVDGRLQVIRRSEIGGPGEPSEPPSSGSRRIVM
jgi:hypothetical protein